MADPTPADCRAICRALDPEAEGRLTPADVRVLRRVLAPFHSLAAKMDVGEPEADLLEAAHRFLGFYAMRYNYWERESWFRPGEAPEPTAA